MASRRAIHCFLGASALAAVFSSWQVLCGAETTANSIGMKLVLVPSGEFIMGGSETAVYTAAFFKKLPGLESVTADLFKSEYPPHHVRITRPLYLGMYHVTRGQFRRFVEGSGHKTDAENGERPGAFGWNPDTKKFGMNRDWSWRKPGFEQTDGHPVVCVSWNDATAFCVWLSRKEGKTCRLPTEAEWEYACRAGTRTQYFSGDDPETLAEVGNVADAAAKARFPDAGYAIKANDGYAFTSAVGRFKPNALGLFDMHGNAGQWCADWYQLDYYAESPREDPAGPSHGVTRVVRGGGWNGSPAAVRSAYRNRNVPDSRNNSTGFRVVMVP